MKKAKIAVILFVLSFTGVIYANDAKQEANAPKDEAAACCAAAPACCRKGTVCCSASKTKTVAKVKAKVKKA